MVVLNHDVSTFPGIREAVIGFDGVCNVLFFYVSDLTQTGDGTELVYRSVDEPAFEGESVPILALKPAGSGLWYDNPNEWVMDEPIDTNGFVAFTEDAAAYLCAMASAGDLLIPLKAQVQLKGPGQS